MMNAGEASVEQEREAQRKARTCVCGKEKQSAFLSVCDSCWLRLPCDLRRKLATTDRCSAAGREAKKEAEAWLKLNHG